MRIDQGGASPVRSTKAPWPGGRCGSKGGWSDPLRLDLVSRVVAPGPGAPARQPRFTNYGQLRRHTDCFTRHRLAQIDLAVTLVLTTGLGQSPVVTG